MSATDFEMELGFETGEKWCPVCEEYVHDIVECEYMDREQPSEVIGS